MYLESFYAGQDVTTKIYYVLVVTSSETQGQIVWARESLNGREIWHEEK